LLDWTTWTTQDASFSALSWFQCLVLGSVLRWTRHFCGSFGEDQQTSLTSPLSSCESRLPCQTVGHVTPHHDQSWNYGATLHDDREVIYAHGHTHKGHVKSW